MPESMTEQLVTRPGHLVRKRVLDTALIIASAPLTLPAAVVTGLFVRKNMGSPVFYRQPRIGLNGRTFELLKFRSMLPETDEQGQLRPDNERMTPFGKLLRASSLDELPQLLNVLRGDMSLVGPRPLLVEYLPFYTATEQRRHAVRPGITGAAQVNGRNSLDWPARLQYDVDYADNANLLDDLRILVKTVLRVLDRSDTGIEHWDHFESFDEYRSYPADEQFSLRRVEPRDAEFCIRLWQENAASVEIGAGDPPRDPDSFSNWLKATRSDSTRRDLAVYQVSSGELVGVAGWLRGTDPTCPEMYVSLIPEVDQQQVWSSALALVLELLRDQDGVSGAVLTATDQHVEAAGLRGFRLRGGSRGEGQGRLEIRWDGAVPAVEID